MNTVARSLKLSKTHTIGFMAPEIANDFFMSIAQGVEDTLRESGYSMIVCNSGERTETEERTIELLLEKCVDGIIIIPATDSGTHFGILSRQSIPVVLADGLVDGFTADAVLVDNVGGTYRAVEYLIDEGSRRFGFIGGDMSLTSARERYRGFLKALSDRGIGIDRDLIRFGDFHVESGYRLMKELMHLPAPPDHVFIANHYMHVGATKYLIDARDSLAARVEIASFDDMEISSILGFCSVNVRQPVQEIGHSAARLLLERMTGGLSVSPITLRLETEIVRHARLRF